MNIEEKEITRRIEEMRKAADVNGLMAILKKRGQDSLIRQRAREALGKLGDMAVEPLIDLLTDEEADLRFRAILALSEIGDTRAVEPLIATLKDEVSYVRDSAASALGELKDSRAVKPLIGVLNDEEEHVRQVAREALENIGGPEAEQALLIETESERTKSEEQDLCEMCKNEPGNPYTFLYGRSSSTVTTATPTVTQTSTSVRIKGSETVLVGDRCISRIRVQNSIFYAVVSLVLVAVAVWGIFLSNGGWLLGLLGVVSALFSLSMIFRFVQAAMPPKQERGTEIAISIRKGKLKRMGYDYFTSQSTWEATKAYYDKTKRN